MRQRSMMSLTQRSSTSLVSTTRTGAVRSRLHLPMGTRTGPVMLRSASIDCAETFVPFGVGPECILLKPNRMPPASYHSDLHLWNTSLMPDPNDAMVKKPIYDSAVDVIASKPGVLQASAEQKRRIKEYNQMLDDLRARANRDRVLREKAQDKEKRLRAVKLREEKEKREEESRRHEQKVKAIRDEKIADIEDRERMLDKIWREKAALGIVHKEPPVWRKPKKSLAESIGCATRHLRNDLPLANLAD